MLTLASMATIRASRTIAADPASVALLLAGPTAAEQFADDTALAGAGVDVDVIAPRRAGIGFAAPVTVLSAGSAVATGSVNVLPAPGAGTSVEVVLQADRNVNLAALRHWLNVSLMHFESVARARSSAA